jgi:hypothetical protein
MSDTSVVTFIEEWQTGAFLLLIPLIGGLLIGYASVPVFRLPVTVGIGVFVVAASAIFLAMSYLVYGR